jgi:hypothetical protein
VNTKRFKIEVYGNELIGMGTAFYNSFFGKLKFFEELSLKIVPSLNFETRYLNY